MSSEPPRTTADWVVSVAFIAALFFGIGAIRNDYGSMTLVSGLILVPCLLVIWDRNRRRQ